MKDETINLDVIRKLAKLNFETLKAEKDGNYMAEIKFYNYYDMMFTAVNMLKLCMLALDHEVNAVML
ncbi:hypothetical protein [Flavobacterium hungaricum]|uniref:HEPN domain-containing protein n=1 Tax=Flavobacterium hungaricum TaxID=2082725 RepID=A0ABR9TH36_9FLAO|nr:hypothetical protein [Flavobacterium hungaricum]MBE8724347.1 hypothetical protein [Flavobacterium hungaricum]